MAGSSTAANPASLSEWYENCMQAFREFLLALGETNCRAIRLEQVHLPEILEEYGRAKIWGDQTKADLPARARGSLDDALRHDDDLKQLVQGIFVRLRALLGQATSIAERKYDLLAGSDCDSISSVSADSDSGTDDDADADGQHQRRSMPKIRLIVQQIVGQIRSLYDLSSLLRRPSIADKYIRSVSSKLNTSTSSDSDALPLSVGFRTSDESHVAEKVLQWRGLTKSGLGVKFEEEEPAPTGKDSTSDGMEDILWFCQRLARANTRRREQLQYWTANPYDPKKDVPSAAQLPSQDLADVLVKQIEVAQESRSQTSTLKPPDRNLLRTGPRSAVSKQSFSTAAVSLVHDTKTNVRPRTVYALTAVGKGRSNSVPDPPKAKDGLSTFPCPYCGMTLEVSEMRNRQSWQRHVFRDLRPYVCTFEDCQNSGKLYISRGDWIHHELQVHRRNYVCKECNKRCPNRREASTHLREHYGESTSPSQLNVILDLSERQVDVSAEEKDPCLICGEELSLSTLQSHIATHMEDIALFVLPNVDEEEGTGGSKASVQVARLESKGKASYLESDVGSLGFSVSGGHGQNPLDFAKILADEEVGYAAKFSSWETKGDEDGTSTSILRSNMSDLNNYTVGVDFLARLNNQEYKLESPYERMEKMNNLGNALYSQGKHDEAEAMHHEALELRKQLLGRDHPDTLTSMEKLGNALYSQGKYDEAEAMHCEALELREKVLGPNHPDTLTSMNNLALVRDSQGKFFGDRDAISARPLVVRRDGGRIYLPMGRFHGVLKMSEFTTYPPTQATFSVDQIDDWECSALVPSDLAAQALQQSHDQVVPRRWSLGIDTLKVLVHPSLGGEFQKALYAALQYRIKGNVDITETNDSYKPDSAVFRITMNTDDNDRIDIAGSPSLIGYEGPVRGLDLTGVNVAQRAAKSAAILAHLVRLRQILDLSNGAGQPDAPFKVTLKPYGSEGGPLAGQWLRMRFVFENMAKSRLYFTFLVLGSGFCVMQLYPLADSPQSVDEGGEVSLDCRIPIPDLLKDYEDQRDIIRIVVTRGRQVSWKSLELPDIWHTERWADEPCGSGMGATTRSECSYWVEDIKVLSTKRGDGDDVYWRSRIYS